MKDLSTMESKTNLCNQSFKLNQADNAIGIVLKQPRSDIYFATIENFSHQLSYMSLYLNSPALILQINSTDKRIDNFKR